MTPKPTTSAPTVKADQDEKLEYQSPELREHGNAAEITLQTFFGSFSP